MLSVLHDLSCHRTLAYFLLRKRNVRTASNYYEDSTRARFLISLQLVSFVRNLENKKNQCACIYEYVGTSNTKNSHALKLNLKKWKKPFFVG